MNDQRNAVEVFFDFVEQTIEDTTMDIATEQNRLLAAARKEFQALVVREKDWKQIAERAVVAGESAVAELREGHKEIQRVRKQMTDLMSALTASRRQQAAGTRDHRASGR
jgi:hypothetical protein